MPRLINGAVHLEDDELRQIADKLQGDPHVWNIILQRERESESWHSDEARKANVNNDRRLEYKPALPSIQSIAAEAMGLFLGQTDGFVSVNLVMLLRKRARKQLGLPH